jgi:two-component system, cell cycle sensor histidine kinase and response regulator CckA
MKDVERSREELLKEVDRLRIRLEELEKPAGKMEGRPGAPRESDEDYRLLFESNGVGALMIEEDMNVSLVNKEFERLAGYSQEDIRQGKKWTELVSPESMEKMKEYHRLRRVDPEKVPRSYETQVVTKGGRTIDVLIIGRMIPGTRKTLVSFLDITQLKQVEREVSRLAHENALLTEISRIFSSTLEIDEVIERFAREAQKLIPFTRVSVNILNAEEETFTHLYVSGTDVPGRGRGDIVPLAGTAGEEVLRSRSALLIGEENLEEARRRFPALQALIQTGFRSLVLVPLISKERVIGVLNFGSRQANAYQDSHAKIAGGIGNQIAGAIANAQLFAGIRRAEEALRVSEEKYRTLVENATDIILIIQDERIKFANPLGIVQSGYAAEELFQIPIAELIHPDDRETVLGRYRQKIQGKQIPGIQTYRLLNKSGEFLWVQVNSVPITWEDRPATLNFVRDITQEKKLEAQFQTAQKMEAIGTLAGGIAHDFNNLLMAIQAHVSLLLFSLDSNHPHYESLKKIEEQVKRGANLATQLLAFARRGKYEVKPSDLNRILQSASGMFERTKKELKIFRQYQEKVWIVEVDREQMEQVLLNLFVNAWQAMPDGGNLFLETRNTTIGPDYLQPFAVQPGKYVRLTVRDTGIGMDKKTAERVFEPFFTTKEMGRGTGLGLASVYGIVKNHGGFITVYSEVGHGTTFHVYLPASDKEMEAEKKYSGAIPKGNETVLLVDDEQTIVDVMEKALLLTGYKVLVARGGEEAIEVFRKNRDRIDLVILDMIMPGMGGGKVFDSLRAIDPGVKVILSSGYSIDGEASQIMARGCNGFIQKPFGIKELSQKIREIADQP